MFRGLFFCSILAAQCVAVSATRRDDASLRQNLNSGNGNGPSAAIHRADDPFPCPGCELSDPGGGHAINGRIRSDSPLMIPFPVPECGSGDPAGGPPDQRA